MSLPHSVTRWLDYFFNIWTFTSMKVSGKGYNVCQSRLHILPNFNNPSLIAQRLLNCCQSGEISPNLVTLLPSLPPHFVCFCFASRTGLSILHFKRFHFEKENTRYRCYYYDLYYFFYFFFSPFVISSIGPPQPV